MKPEISYSKTVLPAWYGHQCCLPRNGQSHVWVGGEAAECLSRKQEYIVSTRIIGMCFRWLDPLPHSRWCQCKWFNKNYCGFTHNSCFSIPEALAADSQQCWFAFLLSDHYFMGEGGDWVADVLPEWEKFWTRAV